MVKAIFLDKDGTLVDGSMYPEAIPSHDLLEGVEVGLREAMNKGYKLFIISNQPWIAKKMASKAEIEEIFKTLVLKLKDKGIEIEDYVYCPHQSSDNCDCKKPKPKMAFELIEKYDIDPENSFMVGDMDMDILFGKNADLKTVLVQTGMGREYRTIGADYIIKSVENLGEVI